MSSNTHHSNILIIGAGSAGAVLANRLSEDPHCQVTLLEAGGSDRRLIVQMPSAFYLPVKNKTLNWGYESEPEPHLNNRRLLCPRGRVLGGSSSINGMVYVRGNAADYAAWTELGAKNWDYNTVLPYFRKAQNFSGATADDPYKGSDGPLAVCDGELSNPLYQTFLEAAAQAGHNLSADLNGAQQEGFGTLPMTVDKGVRASTARAYLRPALHRPNLSIHTRTHALHLLFDGNKAIGVNAEQRGRNKAFYADQVILCGGAINTPQLLMCSGIGSAAALQQVGISPKLDLPGVGQNLMDHLEIYVQQACEQPVSLYKDLNLFGRAKLGVQWLVNQRGLGATNHFEVGGFIKSEASAPYPNIQFHFLPAAMQYDGSAKAEQHGFQAHVGPMLSQSRGEVTLASNNPKHHPRIVFNYMSHPEDWQVFRQAIRTAREIFAQPAFEPYRGIELRPGAQAQSDAELDAFIRANAESAYHPCGTCRMGEDDTSVVNSEGQVHGIDGLSVVDASIFPRITNGNLNAVVIMVAERCADLIKART
ncbi:MAG: choline dehydrogenase [Pseudomonadaceae bacterium]|nr:choline dehydrogenase [Pseudomonadaceae bacterium]